MTAKRILAFCAVLFITVMVMGLLPVSGEEVIYDEVIRLHVLANSDSEEDQALKLKVRDAVLAETELLVGSCESREEALAILSESQSRDRLTAAAQRVIGAAGYEYEVSVSLGEERYPTRSYEAFCFPSGTYTSLRVEIGASAGKNWWCVLFPRLCLGAASGDAEEKFIEAGFTPEQYKIITDTDEPEYKIKFKILEIIEELVG